MTTFFQLGVYSIKQKGENTNENHALYDRLHKVSSYIEVYQNTRICQ